MPGGRPTTLTPEIVLLADGYLEAYVDSGETVPSLAGLSKHIGASRSSVYLWKDKAGDMFEEFSDICSQVMECQEIKLMNGGLSSDYNATITKLMLTKHGYTDKQEIHQEVKEVKELSDFYSDSNS